jgi:uncharacterized membrane protein YdjX (TVP38/TMEM64 family)
MVKLGLLPTMDVAPWWHNDRRHPQSFARMRTAVIAAQSNQIEVMATASLEPLQTWINRRAWLLRRVAIFSIVGSILLILWSVPIKSLVQRLEVLSQAMGFWAPVAFVATFTALTVFSLPVWPMPFLAGAMFGTVWGTVVASASCVVAASATFLLARYLGRTSLRDYLEASPRMRALEKTVAVSNWKVIAAVRLSHFLPFGLQNYALGLTEARFKTFVVTTWLVTLPGTLFQAYLGHLGFTSVDAWQQQSAESWQVWGMRLGGLLIIAAAVAYVGYLGRSVYRRELQSQLEKRLQSEVDGTHNHSWPWGLTLLIAFAAVMVMLAAWSVIQRDELRDYANREVAVSSWRSQSKAAAASDEKHS